MASLEFPHMEFGMYEEAQDEAPQSAGANVRADAPSWWSDSSASFADRRPSRLNIGSRGMDFSMMRLRQLTAEKEINNNRTQTGRRAKPGA